MDIGKLLMAVVLSIVSLIIAVFVLHRFTDINVGTIGEKGGFLGPK